MKSTPLFKVFSVTYPILRRIEVTLMINNFIISVTSWHLAFKYAY